MRNDRGTIKKSIAWLMTWVIISTIFVTGSSNKVEAVDSSLIWLKNDIMDTSLNIVKNKAGRDDLLLECLLDQAGTYNLTYYLEDHRKTSVKITQTFEQLSIAYKIEETVGGVTTNITQSEADLSYLAMDYSLTVPDWKFNGNITTNTTTGALDYVISRSASTKYPGLAFNINNKKVIIKWDFQANKMYFMMTGYNDGQIMPITFVKPSTQVFNMKALKNLEGFVVTPTHLKANAAGTANEEVNPIVYPTTSGESPGSRPGLDIQFKQPRELDVSDWTYKYATTNLDTVKAIVEVSDIGSSDYLDMNFFLSQTTNSAIYELPNEDLNNDSVNDNLNNKYVYNPATFTYNIQIVKDKQELLNQDEIVQWNKLEGSKIYNVDIGFEIQSGLSDYQFITYTPEAGFAYTYMQYKLKRANKSEAYLDIVPYDVGNQEQVEYTILYSKVIKPQLNATDDLWLKHYHSEGNTGTNINIPVPFRKDSSQDVYQIVVDFSGTKINSQVLNYRAKDDVNVPPTTPIIKAIDNVYVVPPEDVNDNDPTKIQLDLTFTAPDNRVIKELDEVFANLDLNGTNDHLYYEVLANDVPQDTTANPYSVIKVFEVYRDSGDYKIRLHSALTGNETPSSAVGFSDGYNSVDQLFRMDKINLYENHKWTPVIQTTIDEVANTYTVSPTTVEAKLELPGVNYLRVRAIAIKDGKLSTSFTSIPESLSLSLVKYNIPIVDNLSYKIFYGLTEGAPTGITLDWHSVAIDNYENHMLYPVDKTIKTVEYLTYFSQSETSLMEIDPESTSYTAVSLDGVSHLTVSSAQLDKLRQGNVLYFDKVTTKDTNSYLDMDLEGLDLNSNYYARIITKIVVKNLVDNTEEIRYSDASTILSMTTPLLPDEPGDAEVVPLTPELLTVDYADESLLSAKLSWQIPAAMSFEEDKYGFEIVALEDVALPSNLSSKDFTAEQIFSSSLLTGVTKEAWRIYVVGGVGVIKKYNSTTGVWEAENSAYLEVKNNMVYMVDASNAPNKVNYYYVRTINIKAGVPKSHSTWAKATLTTAPVKGPINLIADFTSSYTYDPKSAFIIRFDAPVPDTANLTTDYVMQIFVKSEDDLDYSMTKYTTTYLGKGTGATSGYQRLYYRVTGLKAGKVYYVKVRIEDRTKGLDVLPSGLTTYPVSPYSEWIFTRTEFNQSEYDKENKYQEYIKYYETTAEKLKYSAYYETVSTTDKSVFKYRSLYANGEIKRNANGEYNLVATNKSTNVYCFPSDFFESANSNRVTVTLQPNNQKIGIRPFSLGVDITTEINNIINRIHQYSSTITDYYIRVTVSTGAYNGTINGKMPASQLVTIRFDVIGSKLSEYNLDTAMTAEITNSIASKKPNLITLLDKELLSGINDTKLLGIVQTVLASVQAEYRGKMDSLLNTTVEPIYTEIVTLNKSLSIGLINTSSNPSCDVYMKKSNAWQKMTSTYLNQRYTIETTEPLSYILLPGSVGTSDLSTIYATNEMDIINKYKLLEVFTTADLKTPTLNILKDQYIKAMARMLGAASGYDTADFLKAQGITFNATSLYGTLSNEEALNLYVQVFAKKHLWNLNQVNIRDYYMISDYGQVQSSYQKNILIGANLGIITLNNGNVEPKRGATMKDVITQLTLVEKGIDW